MSRNRARLRPRSEHGHTGPCRSQTAIAPTEGRSPGQPDETRKGTTMFDRITLNLRMADHATTTARINATD
jgi:hypothetical protein